MRQCSIKDCINTVKAHNLCSMHNNHVLRYGEIRWPCTRPNEILDKETYYEIVLYDNHLRPRQRGVKISKEDLPLVQGKRFYFSHGYAKLSQASPTVYLHQILLPCVPPLVCDHINQDKLDCRRENLRSVTRKQNIENMTVSLAKYRWGDRLKKHVV